MSGTPHNLPDLSEDYSLSARQIADYERDGHLLLRGVCNAGEIEAYEPYIKAAVDRFSVDLLPLAQRDTYGMAFIQVMNLWVHDEMLRRRDYSCRLI